MGTKLIPPSFKSIGAPRPPIPCADQKCLARTTPPGGFFFALQRTRRSEIFKATGRQ